MTSAALIFILLAYLGLAAAQEQHAENSERAEDAPQDHQFEYHGCAEVNLGGFSDPMTLPNGLLTHKVCQILCEGWIIAAIFADSCRCGNDAGSFEPLDESACDNPCLGSHDLEMCGSYCPGKGPNISTIYMIKDESVVEREENVTDIISSVSISPTVEVSRSSSSNLVPTTRHSIPDQTEPGSPIDPILSSWPQEPINPPEPSETTSSLPPNVIVEPNPSITSPAAEPTFMSSWFNGTVPNTERDGDTPDVSQVPGSEGFSIKSTDFLKFAVLVFLLAAAG